MRGLCFPVGAALLLGGAVGCARFELLGGGGEAGTGGSPPVGAGTSNGGEGPSAGGPTGGSPGNGGAPPCDDATLEMDPFNCGSCGHDCYGGDCSGGICQFEQLWQSGGEPAGRFAQGVAVGADRVVWVSDAGTLSLPLAAPSGTEPIAHSYTEGTRVALRGPTIYRTWGTLITTPLSADASVMNEDGVWGSGQCSYDLVIDEENNTYCVAIANDVGSVYRYNTSFSATMVASALPFAFGIEVDDTYFYVGYAGGIWRQEKPPSNMPGEVIVNDDVIGQLIRVGSDIYFGTSEGLNRLNTLDGDAVTVFGGVAPNSIHVDGQHIWFTNQDDEQVWRVDLDGQNPRTWGVGGGQPDVIAGNDLFVFVTTDEDGRLTRLAK
jgi:hypothetical protein